jgi:small conductance mechanosensitive channel
MCNGCCRRSTPAEPVTRPARAADRRTAQLPGSVDPLEAIERFRAAVAQIPNVATHPAPEGSVLDINLVGPAIAVRPCCRNGHHWQVYFDTNAALVQVAPAGRRAGGPTPTPTQIIRTAPLA